TILTNPKIGYWSRAEVSSHLNVQRSYEVTRIFSSAAKEATQVLMFYFVGHGVLNERGELILAFAQTESDQPGYTGVPYEWIAEILRRSRAKTKIVILDCCYAGQAIEALGDSTLADLSSVKGVYTLTATVQNSLAHVPVGTKQACTSF